MAPNKNLEQLRSYCGAVNQLNGLIADSAESCHASRSFPKEGAGSNWSNENEGGLRA